MDAAALEDRNTDELRDLFEERLGRKLSLPVLLKTDGTSELRFRTLPAFRVQSGSATIKKEGERQNGDTIRTFFCRNRFYALICDGMGSGREAALVSRIAVRFIEELTVAGAEPDTVLRTVNGFLLCQSCECSSSVDLLRLDLFDGRCDFIKCGACASLILRGENTFKIASASVPAGASRDVHYESVTVKLREGDRIIMTSDGISDEIEGSLWLKELFAGKLKSDVQGLADDILLLSSRSEKNADDRSVLVIDVVR